MKLICQCGGEVPRPVPPKCPHCGRIITSVRRPALAWLGPLLIVGGLFALLLIGALWLVRVFS